VRKLVTWRLRCHPRDSIFLHHVGDDALTRAFVQAATMFSATLAARQFEKKKPDEYDGQRVTAIMDDTLARFQGVGCAMKGQERYPPLPRPVAGR
jgi:hypothetical protein